MAVPCSSPPTFSVAVMVAVPLFLVLSLLAPSPARATHNITQILADFPDYGLYNNYLSLTKVCDEINSRETVTCLVLPNPVMSTLVAKHPLSAVKKALRLLTLLDYFDTSKLHSISRGTVLTTTLLQTTGSAEGNLGFVNITDLKGGKVGFGSAAPGAKLDSTYTKSVKKMPYSISVLEISAPIVYPGLLDAPAKSTANITSLLVKAGCKTFSSLIVSSGVLKMYQAAMDKGLTVFAPNDEAFKAPRAPNLNKLSQAELVTLLQYHALPEYAPKASLQNKKGPITTLATSGAGKFDISVVTRGDDVSLATGLDNSRVASTVIDETPLCILTVDNVLLPAELFGKAPSPAPGLAPSPAPGLAPSPVLEAPTPGTAPAPAAVSKAPAPTEELSPEGAPMEESPEGAPAMSPDSVADEASNGVAVGVTLASFLVIVAGVAVST